MALFIPEDQQQPVRILTPNNGKTFTLKEMYDLLSCHLVEMRTLSDGHVMVSDEEAKLDGKKRNSRATEIAEFPPIHQMIDDMLRLKELGVEVIWIGDPITDQTTEVDYMAGDVLLCQERELD